MTGAETAGSQPLGRAFDRRALHRFTRCSLGYRLPSMRSPHSVLLLGIVTVCLGASKSAVDEYSRRVWRVPDGLPQNRIQAISQTSEGYLWIGTSGGLARFDGVRFVVFDRSSDTAIRDDSILALCPSRDGSLWIGTEGGGLLHYRNGSFQQFGTKEIGRASYRERV